MKIAPELRQMLETSLQDGSSNILINKYGQVIVYTGIYWSNGSFHPEQDVIELQDSDILPDDLA